MSELTVEPGKEGPVTVSMSRRVKPSFEAEYEAWISSVIKAASRFEGHQGANILRPSQRTDGCYVLIYRFDNWAHCNAWEKSDIRADHVAKLEGIVEGEATTTRVTGLEFWFELPEVPVTAKAPQWKMALVLIAVVFVLVYPLQVVLLPLMPGWPHPVKTLVIVVIQVLLMTYFFMPKVTGMLKSWLFK